MTRNNLRVKYRLPGAHLGTVCGWPSQSALIFAIGNIYFGHFEERKPRWKRAMKIAIVTGAVALLSSAFGALWGLVPVALMLVAAVIVHGWWLPRHGINGITGEPKEKYYELLEARRRKRS